MDRRPCFVRLCLWMSCFPHAHLLGKHVHWVNFKCAERRSTALILQGTGLQCRGEGSGLALPGTMLTLGGPCSEHLPPLAACLAQGVLQAGLFKEVTNAQEQGEFRGRGQQHYLELHQPQQGREQISRRGKRQALRPAQPGRSARPEAPGGLPCVLKPPSRSASAACWQAALWFSFCGRPAVERVPVPPGTLGRDPPPLSLGFPICSVGMVM